MANDVLFHKWLFPNECERREIFQFLNYQEDVITIEPPEKLNCFALKSVFSHLSKIGWENVMDLNVSLDFVTLRYTDAASRLHQLLCTIPENYSKEPLKQIIVDLPAIPSFWFELSDLPTLYQSFCRHVDDLQTLFGQLDSLDTHTWILEDQIGSCRASTGRGIALGEYASMLLDLDINNPMSFPPTLQLMGPDKVVKNLRDRVEMFRVNWCNSDSIYENLVRLLDITFPTKETANWEDVCRVCSICLSSNLEGQYPTLTCDNSNCQQLFHETCVYEWFSSLPTVRQTFNTLYGECPFCNENMSVTIKLRK